MLMLDRGRELVERRQVLWLLVVRDLKVRYSSSALGYLWTIIDPLMMACVYWLVFGLVFNGASRGLQPYVVFLVVGVLAWQWFNSGVMDTTRALQQESRLVRSTSLPREVWVLKIVLAKGVEFVLSIPVIGLFMVIYGHHPTWAGLWSVPAAIALQLLLVSGIGLALASLTVLVTDLQRVVRILLRVMFYLTPVLYSVHILEKSFDVPHITQLVALNPMAGIIDLYRRAVFEDTQTPWHVPAIGAVVTLVIFVVGAWIFRRLEPAVLKEL
jgi:ABC-2 type transport system permease protein